ncbi:MAG: cell division protein FtsZ [Bacteroidales bacterium]|nr:cell division protein FtsZ [Bacteroidales bacterium]
MEKANNNQSAFSAFSASETPISNMPESMIKTSKEEMIKFNLPKEQSSIIKVIGVGGGGSNAVNHMFQLGIKDVDFIVCNTDAQALQSSPVPIKIQLGAGLTEGRGAGSLPEVGKNSAKESIEDIVKVLEQNTKMLFITAGMGGGTGTGAAPVIAEKAKELGILTVGIVTIPFTFEGRKRALQAREGIKELRKNVDSLLIICNDKLRELYGNLELSKAFSEADSVLTTAAKGIAEIITMTGYVNVDFEDVRTVMKDSGVAIMGAAVAEGEDRAIKAVKKALESPLLNDNNIKGASDMLLYIASGDKEILMDEVMEITDYIQLEAGETAEVIWGNGYDPSLGNKISITVIATGFETTNGTEYTPKLDIEKRKPAEPEKIIIPLHSTQPTPEPTLEVAEPIKGFTIKGPQIAPEVTTTVTNEPKVVKETNQGFVLKTNIEPPVEQNSKKEQAVVNQNTTPVQTEIQKPILKQETIEDKQQIGKLDENRQNLLKELSIRLKDANQIPHLEGEPAYKRKNVQFQDVPHSSESHVSKYTLSADDSEDGKPKLKPNNSFLHEKPD